MGELLARRRRRRSRRRQHHKCPKIMQNQREVLFPEIGHVTQFREHAPKKKRKYPWSRPPNSKTALLKIVVQLRTMCVDF